MNTPISRSVLTLLLGACVALDAACDRGATPPRTDAAGADAPDKHDDPPHHGKNAGRDEHDKHEEHDKHDKHEEHEEHDKHDKHGGPAGPAGAGGAEVVQVAPEMLRDLRVTTTTVDARAAGERVTLPGALRVNDDAYAEVASAIPARVKSVSVALGDGVRAGQALAEVESADIGKARAELLHARAQSELLMTVVARKTPLVADNVVPARELQQAQAEQRAADAALQAARATLLSFGLSDSDVDKTTEAGGTVTLRAPIAGTVIERNAVRGGHVDAEHTLFRIADESQLWLVVHAFERDALRIAVGSQANVVFPALPGKSFIGKVTNVGREVEPVSRTIPVRIAIHNTDGALRSGMSASAAVPIGDGSGASIVAIPLMALQRLERDWVAFVPIGDARDGVFAVRRVGRGRDLGDEVEVVSGLTAGDEVVVEGAFLLKAEVEKSSGGGDAHEH